MPVLLRVEGLTVEVAGAGGPSAAIRDADLSLDEGRCRAVLGESGSGKTLLARAIVGLLPPGARRREGDIRLDGISLPPDDGPAWRGVRGSRIGFVFQEPLAALDPLWRAGAQVIEALPRGVPGGAGSLRERALALLSEAALPDPERIFAAYPGELSGGERQRVAIAAALAGGPQVLIADEPTASLDAEAAEQVWELLDRLCRLRGLALLLITHDLAAARRRADDVTVMYAGRIVEAGPAAGFFAPGGALHPYSRALLRCAEPPPAAGAPRARPFIPGRVPSPGERRADECLFAPRCDEAEDACRRSEPPLVRAGARSARCIHVRGDGTP